MKIENYPASDNLPTVLQKSKPPYYKNLNHYHVLFYLSRSPLDIKTINN